MQVTIYGTKTVFLKRPDYLKIKTFENQSQNKNEEFNTVFGTKKSIRISKSKIHNEVSVSSNIFSNISTNCMYRFCSKCLFISTLLFYLL